MLRVALGGSEEDDDMARLSDDLEEYGGSGAQRRGSVNSNAQQRPNSPDWIWAKSTFWFCRIFRKRKTL